MSWPGVRIGGGQVGAVHPDLQRFLHREPVGTRVDPTVAPLAPPLSPRPDLRDPALSINRPMIKEAYYFSADGIGGMSSARRPVGSRWIGVDLNTGVFEIFTAWSSGITTLASGK